MVGLPGTGKTTFAHSLSHWLGGLHLRADKIGLELFRFPTYSPAERQAVHQEMLYQTVEALQAGQPVLYDAAVNTRTQRDQLLRLTQTHNAEVVGLWLQTELSLAKKRAAMARDQGVAGPVVRVIPPHIFDQYIATFEAPSSEESVAYIPGDAPFAVQYAHLQRQLQAHHKLPKLI